MPVGLETCPPEVVEGIIELLDLKAVCNLRLSCVSLATNSTQRSLKRFFHSKQVDLTANALLAFSRVTGSGGVSCLVQDLHLVGIVREVERPKGLPEWLTASVCDSPASDELPLLTEAFHNLAKYSKDGTLPSLSLRVAYIRYNGQRDIPLSLNQSGLPHKTVWQCTVNTFNTAIRALASSKLRVRRLNIFNGLDLQRCSLACDQLNTIDWRDLGIVDSFATLTTLSISLCDRIFTFREDKDKKYYEGQNLIPSSTWEMAVGGDDISGHENNIEDESQRQFPRNTTKILTACQDEINFTGLANLLSVCTQLMHLELHYFRITWSLENDLSKSFRREKLLEHVVRLGRLPDLTCCTIRGLSLREADLLEFLQRTRVTKLSMEHSYLCTGTLQPILDYCISPSAGISKLYFNAIHQTSSDGEYQGLVLFREKGESIKYECILDDGTELLNRQGSKSVQNPITYYVQPPFAEGEPSVRVWIRSRRLEYGP